jgi:peptidoglycan/xylan/chitin deacetylase (PgdA/CDA1 family)
MGRTEFKIRTIRTLLAGIKPTLVAKGHFDDAFCLKLFDLLYGKKFSWKKKMGRVALNMFLQSMPLAVEIQALNILKKLIASDKEQAYREPKSFLVYDYLAPAHSPKQYPHNKLFYLGLSFDIDNKIDYSKLPPLLEDLRKLNLPATVNVITHGDYQFDQLYMKTLQAGGVEIGLHGDTHNSALSFLPQKAIKYKLQRAIDRLGFVPSGFRTPGLSFSDVLIDVLDELGFLYDSSLTTGITMYKSIEFPYVFRYRDTRIIEVPVFMQDYNFFVNNLYSERETITIFKRQLEEISLIGGVALINLHPSMIYNRKYFWDNFMEMTVYHKETAYISTIQELVKVIPLIR